MNLMAAGVAHFYTVYAFPDSQKPRYYAGGAMMSAACVICACAALGIKWHLKRLNAVFEREERGGGEMRGYGGVSGSKHGGGGEAVVAFRYVH